MSYKTVSLVPFKAFSHAVYFTLKDDPHALAVVVPGHAYMARSINLARAAPDPEVLKQFFKTWGQFVVVSLFSYFHEFSFHFIY